MVPSFKFTLIAWMAFIGLGSLSLVLKDRKSPASVNHSKSAIVVPTNSNLTGAVSMRETCMPGVK